MPYPTEEPVAVRPMHVTAEAQLQAEGIPRTALGPHWTQGLHVLEVLLAALSLKLKRVYGTGSCLYDAIAAVDPALGSQPGEKEIKEHGEVMRRQVATAFAADVATKHPRVQLMGDRLADFRNAGASGDLYFHSLEDYEAAFHSPGVYTDDYMLDYTAEQLNMIITVVQPRYPFLVRHHPIRPEARQRILQQPDGTHRHATVAFRWINGDGQGHYEAVVPLYGQPGDGSWAWAWVAAGRPLFGWRQEFTNHPDAAQPDPVRLDDANPLPATPCCIPHSCQFLVTAILFA